jgi:hypothetical protein
MEHAAAGESKANQADDLEARADDDRIADELVGKEGQVYWQSPQGWFDAKVNSWNWEQDENGKRVRVHEVCCL